MNRPIKFRAWDEKRKVFFYWGLDVENGAYFTGPPHSELNHCQFTGLLDKNGKEIYEGDIVSLRSTKKYGSELYNTTVIFQKSMFTVKENKTYFHDFAAIGRCEVVGNIYETPELLK